MLVTRSPAASARCSRWLMLLVSSAALTHDSGADVGSPPSDETALLAPSEIRSLQAVAPEYPCAATALLYVLYLGGHASEGVLYFNGVPSARTVLSMLERTDREMLRDGIPAVQINPYSGVPFLVEVRWSLERVGGQSSILRTRAQLVDGQGAALQPIHPVERPAAVLHTRGTFYLLEEARPL